MGKTLIIYYSRRGENYVNGSIVNLEKGNTEIVAEYLKEATGKRTRKISRGPEENMQGSKRGYRTCYSRSGCKEVETGSDRLGTGEYWIKIFNWDEKKRFQPKNRM